MGWSSHHPVGLIHNDTRRSFRGYTLLCNNRAAVDARLIDMEGRICHRWRWPDGIGYSRLLPNGNLLLRTRPQPEASAVGGFGGSSGAVVELDWDSNLVWQYRNPMIHHDFDRLENGNTLVLLWEPIPAELTRRVVGGYRADDDPEQMLGDVVEEITPDGASVHRWESWLHLNVDEDVICPLEGRKEFTHGNAISVTPHGELLVSYRQTSTIGLVNRATGDFRWKWGPGVVSHQHHPTFLDNGRVLLFDNGCHRRGIDRSRIVEVDPETNEIAWDYTADPVISFYSYNISSAQRLPNGNTLVCEGAAGRTFEVTPSKELVWEYINPVFLGGQGPTDANPTSINNAVFRAHRYGPDYPGLQDKDLDPGRYANINRLYA